MADSMKAIAPVEERPPSVPGSTTLVRTGLLNGIAVGIRLAAALGAVPRNS